MHVRLQLRGGQADFRVTANAHVHTRHMMEVLVVNRRLQLASYDQSQAELFRALTWTSPQSLAEVTGCKCDV